MSGKYYMAAVIRKDKANEAGEIPIYLRFKNKTEKQSFLSTGVWIKKEEYWHKKSRYVIDGPNFKGKNKEIEKMYNECEERISKAITEGEGPTVRAFKGLTLIDFEAYIKEVEKHKRKIATINHLKDFHGSMPQIENITVKFLRLFQDWMYGVLNFEDNSVRTYMSCIRKVMNQALREKFITNVPFGTGLYLLPDEADSDSKFLTTDERHKALDHLLNKRHLFQPDTYKVLAYFMLGCYAGPRFSDWEGIEYNKNVKDGKLIYITKKTKTKVTIPIRGSLGKVLEVIKEVGPLDLTYHVVSSHLEKIQLILEFETHLTTHVGRHSFGHMCASKGITPAATARLMGISSIEVVLNVYYHLTDELITKQTEVFEAA